MNVPYNCAPNDSHICAAWYHRYFSTKPEECEHLNYGPMARTYETDIYITTFGNKWFAEYQIKTLRRFFLSPHKIFIIDTNQSLNPEISRHLWALCEREDVGYIKPPDNHYQEAQHFDPTLKLGTTLSWLFQNVAKKRCPRYFGFLDHDCFLFKDTTIGGDIFPVFSMYGTVSRNLPKWNLHVITNFFTLEAVENLPLDFRASHKHGLDTGGANFDILYHKFNMEDYVLPHIGVRYTEEDICRKDAVQHYEIIDNRWFHIAATSHDLLAGDGQKKLLYARGFLDAALRISEPNSDK